MKESEAQYRDAKVFGKGERTSVSETLLHKGFPRLANFCKLHVDWKEDGNCYLAR